jgi:hypothetical protein
MVVVTLAEASAMVPFAAWWAAAAVVLGDDALPAERYPHHRFADPGPLVDAAERCGWRSTTVELIDTVRTIDADELWTWLSGSLPMKRRDGSDVDRADRDRCAGAMRDVVLACVEPWRTGTEYALPIAAWMLTFRREAASS